VDIRQLSKEERRELYERILVAACRLTRSRSAAEDLTQEAFLRLDTTRPWDPSRPTTFERHVFGILKSLLSQERASDPKRRELHRQAGTEQAALSNKGHSPETISLDQAERDGAEALATKRVALLRAKVADFELDLVILDLMSEDVTKRADLVRRTSRSPDQVKTSLARIRRHMDSILAAERGEPEDTWAAS
jgi:DNA-directed RNA polymerase specialized sigma24 family protein